MSGMWSPYNASDRGEPAANLPPAFVLVKAETRAVDTVYGRRLAVDLWIATTTPGDARYFSGFSAGIASQVKRLAAGDLPMRACVRSVPTDKGQTTILVPLDAAGQVLELDPGMDDQAVTAALASARVALDQAHTDQAAAAPAPPPEDREPAPDQPGSPVQAPPADPVGVHG